MGSPLWLYSWDASWTCLRSPRAHVLGSTVQCQTCPRWEAPAETAGVPCPGGVDRPFQDASPTLSGRV